MPTGRSTRDDRKLFWITFGGTLAANLLTVVVAALGIAAVKYKAFDTPPPTESHVVNDLAVVACCALVITGLNRLGNRIVKKSRQVRGVKRLAVIGVVLLTTGGMLVLGLVAVAGVLTLLGYAVGVK